MDCGQIKKSLCCSFRTVFMVPERLFCSGQERFYSLCVFLRISQAAISHIVHVLWWNISMWQQAGSGNQDF